MLDPPIYKTIVKQVMCVNLGYRYRPLGYRDGGLKIDAWASLRDVS
jgi:hypothetical protein